MSHGRRPWPDVLVLVGALVLSFNACGQGEDLAGPGPGVLRITTATSGSATDPDGYTVAIDGRLPRAVGVVDTLLEIGVTPGGHSVDLEGISAGCSVAGGGSRSVTAVEGTTAAVDFSVTCTAPEAGATGALRVTLTTSGVDLDPDGYVVAVDPSESRTVAVSDEVLIEGVLAGQRNVRLSGLAGNCSVEGDNPRSVEIPPAQETALEFAVRCWPPASGRIGFIRVSQPGFREVVIIGADGTVLESFAPTDRAERPSWSPDGRFVAFVDLTVFVQDLGTSTTVALPECFQSSGRPKWSPDGQRILCFTEAGLDGSELYSIRRDGSGRRPLTPSDLSVVSARYVADGSIVFTVGEPEGLAAYRVDADGGPVDRLFAVASSISLFDETLVPSRDASRFAFIRTRDSGRVELYVVGADGNDLRLVSADLQVASLTPPAWSPDGRRLAFEVSGFDGDQLWLVNPDGSTLTAIPLPGSLEFVESFGWSPDGSRLVVAVDEENGEFSNIYTVRADGSGLQRLTASATNDEEPVWGP